MKPKEAPIASLRNLGPASARWLEAIGVRTRDDLEALGAAGAFVEIRALSFKPSWNLLWALHGALYDLPWNELPLGLKAQLEKEVAALEATL